MPTAEERLAWLEAKVEGIADLRRDMNDRFAELRHDMNARFTDVNGRITALDTKVDRQFVWLMGMMLTGFIVIIGALVQLMNR